MPPHETSDRMIEAALETEFQGSTLRGLLNAALWHHGAYGNAKAVIRLAVENALQARGEPFCDPGMT